MITHFLLDLFQHFTNQDFDGRTETGIKSYVKGYDSHLKSLILHELKNCHKLIIVENTTKLIFYRYSERFQIHYRAEP